MVALLHPLILYTDGMHLGGKRSSGVAEGRKDIQQIFLCPALTSCLRFSMLSDGILEEQEEEKLAHAVLRQRQRMERANPSKGLRPGLMAMLENLELLRGMPRDLIRMFRRGNLAVMARGDKIWDGTEELR